MQRMLKHKKATAKTKQPLQTLAAASLILARASFFVVFIKKISGLKHSIIIIICTTTRVESFRISIFVLFSFFLYKNLHVKQL